MQPDSTFEDIIARIRRGDESAEAELFARYDSAVRRAARMKFMHARMQRLMDSEDIRQSVMRSFFVRVRAGNLELRTPGELVSLLLGMTAAKVTDHVRSLSAVKRGGHVTTGDLNDEVAERHQIPERMPDDRVADLEIERLVQSSMTEEERRIVDLRRDGSEWPDIAALLGISADAARKRHERTVDRLTKEFGLGADTQ
ncbi:MAG: hypothetical protein JNL58_03965 [Planctomyces sp.]|nr:hypothetical protein [Planctomyces sp.]